MEIGEKTLETTLQLQTGQARRKQPHYSKLPHPTDVVCEWRHMSRQQQQQ